MNIGDAVVPVQSLRVSLLSTADEVKSLMKTRQRVSKPIDRPTQVSQNPSVQQKEVEGIEHHALGIARVDGHNGGRRRSGGGSSSSRPRHRCFDFTEGLHVQDTKTVGVSAVKTLT